MAEEEKNPIESFEEERAFNSWTAAIGLVTLCRFWPEDRDRYVEIARGHNNPHLNRVIENLDILTSTFLERDESNPSNQVQDPGE